MKTGTGDGSYLFPCDLCFGTAGGYCTGDFIGNRVAREATIVGMMAQDLLNKLHDQPFQPFRVRLSNSSTMDVLNPTTVVVGPSSSIMPMETIQDEHGFYLVTRWRTVALTHMVEFTDIDPPTSNLKRKRAS